MKKKPIHPGTIYEYQENCQIESAHPLPLLPTALQTAFVAAPLLADCSLESDPQTCHDLQTLESPLTAP
jgi:hypothetical protein